MRTSGYQVLQPVGFHEQHQRHQALLLVLEEHRLPLDDNLLVVLLDEAPEQAPLMQVEEVLVRVPRAPVGVVPAAIVPGPVSETDSGEVAVSE